MKKNRVVRGLGITVLVAIAFVAFGYVVMALWNWLVPPIFGWHRISYVQALGLFILSKILFGGFRGGHGHHGHWRRRMRKRWEQMTPEEREKFRKGMTCGCVAPESASLGNATTQPAENL